MEEIKQQSNVVRPKRKGLKWFLGTLFTFLLLLVLSYCYFSMLSAKRKIEIYNTKLDQVLVSAEKEQKTFHPALFKLVNEKAFLSAQNSMMNSDSLNLIVDLMNSTLALVIEGVPIHFSSIDTYEYSPFFTSLSNEAYVQLFSSPFYTESYKSTIVKEPITIKEAPKDTTEAANFFELPDTLTNELVVVTMHLNHDFILTFKQSEEIQYTGFTKDRFFLLGMRYSKILDDLRQLSRLRLPKSYPEIMISLPKDDLITIFRALPHTTQVSIRLR
jgi:hypothetical protein